VHSDERQDAGNGGTEVDGEGVKLGHERVLAGVGENRLRCSEETGAKLLGHMFYFVLSTVAGHGLVLHAHSARIIVARQLVI
jgi:hypothetical protein